LLTGVLKSLPPEAAHRIAIRTVAALKYLPAPVGNSRLRVDAFGVSFPNPLGLAAGFDKSAEALEGLGRLGFGFVEIGTVTPKPQAGNPKPRLFRLESDRSVVNRMGFNNDGYAVVRARLQRASRRGIVGVNIGPNKDAADRIADYVLGLETFAPLADYFTINISSPNTPGLRDFHASVELERLLSATRTVCERTSPRRPLLLKISPDLDDATLEGVLSLSLDYRIDGLIVSNTTVARSATLTSPYSSETGGLSGRPLFEASTRLVARCFLRFGDRIPIVGVGGIEDGRTALAKIEAGARLIQIYTGLVYHGPQLIGEILKTLAYQLDTKGLSSISELTGLRAKEIASGKT
jgi:dihydroorotate dehydrogenase